LVKSVDPLTDAKDLTRLYRRNYQMTTGERLTVEEIDLIRESLHYTEKAYQEYDYSRSMGHPAGYEFKQQQIKTVKELRAKLLRMKKG